MAAHSFLEVERQVSKRWGWFLALGFLLIAAGALSLAAAGTATLTTVLTFGVLLFIAGAVEVAVAFTSFGWRGFGIHFAMGLLMALVGLGLISRPLVGSAILTMMVSLLLLVSGAGRIAFAIVERYAGWGWGALSGLASVVLGALVFAEWPTSALWFLGVMVGCELILRGSTWISLSLGAHRAAKVIDATR